MLRWLLLLAMVSVASAILSVAHLPTPLLFGGLLGGLIYAVSRPRRPLQLPGRWFTVGQAVVGVLVGASVDWGSLSSLGASWAIVLVVSCFSLIVSVLAGQLLVRRGVSRVTATFSSIAGGAAGLTAVADELGADSRVVASLQYLRLLVVLVTMPLVATTVFGASSDANPLEVETHALLTDLAFALVAIVAGLVGGRLLRFPTPAIIGPLVAAALLTLVPVFDDARVPWLVASVGYALIGIQVGLKFTVESLRRIGGMLPTALLTIVTTQVACAALGWVLVWTTDVSPLDAYLATNPGGIYAVLGMSAATGGDVTFVAAAQIVRLIIVLGSAPFVAAFLRRGESG
ncbi:AbrB family transcriptional regulator [Nocardioides sp. cx-173]|uniref:AbrB family transcriptional regulator n=1 Tax=Nocardioides sp. cx-173 TaxID=2898796 RepID=UPI001E656537|nr:AbrB family transcriptional regulator [Nocardioides sp. cx-173]MCD4524037.1 AbrB family transcriptional regulator [Nocardioides sp. cx-173]UGB41438.1 AbrB family transcriptional regulator [Nocardioides sp. cx-173]